MDKKIKTALMREDSLALTNSQANQVIKMMRDYSTGKSDTHEEDILASVADMAGGC